MFTNETKKTRQKTSPLRLVHSYLGFFFWVRKYSAIVLEIIRCWQSDAWFYMCMIVLIGIYQLQNQHFVSAVCHIVITILSSSKWTHNRKLNILRTTSLLLCGVRATLIQNYESVWKDKSHSHSHSHSIGTRAHASPRETHGRTHARTHISFFKLARKLTSERL